MQAKADLEAMAAETAKRQSILQEEQLARYAEQQAALLRVQVEIAAKVHREEVAVRKARDRAIASVTNYKDGEDVQDYLVTTERKLTAGGLKCEEWNCIIASKLGTAWQDVCVSTGDYLTAKDRVLKTHGYTPKLTAELFYGFKPESCRGMQVYHKGVQLFRRMIAPHKVSEEIEFAIIRGWVCSIIPKRARAVKCACYCLGAD